MLDPDKIEQLLNIADKAKNWPNLKRVHDMAMNQLEEYSRSLGTPPEPVETPVAMVTEPVSFVKTEEEA